MLEAVQAQTGAPPGVAESFFCDADVSAFQAANRVTVFPDAWNRWVLMRTTRDNPSDVDIRDTVVAVLRKWFAQSVVSFPFSQFQVPVPGTHAMTPTGRIDNLRVLKVSWEPILGGKTIERREDLPQMVTLRPPGAVWILIEFVYRGTFSSMPWPVHKEQLAFTWCPISADWALARVLEPGKPGAVPGEISAFEAYKRAIGDVVPDFPTPPKLIFFALAAAGAVLLTSKFKESRA